jgi:PRC-barrel domain protein
MWYRNQTAKLAAVAALMVGAAGLSAAADRGGLANQRQLAEAAGQLAQATATETEIPLTPPPATQTPATPTPAAPTPAAEAPAARPPGEASAVFLDNQDVQGILGRQVLSSAGENMGRVIDVVVDRNAQVRAAVIDFGGFLGVGNRKVAVDWGALRFAPTGSKYDRITLDLTRDQLKDAPEYKDGKPLVVLGAAETLRPSPAPE